jgi:hypothetical protein
VLPQGERQCLNLYREPFKINDPPPNGNFSFQLCTSCKHLETNAEVAANGYEEFLNAARGYSERELQANPGLYQGQPPETKEWHHKAAEHAYNVAECYKR